MQESHQSVDPEEILQVTIESNNRLRKSHMPKTLTQLITEYAELEDDDIQ